MNRYYYDLHIHSCLSPCADNDNTPNNIAGMATLCGLDIVALTDHNSCKNCPAFFDAAKKNGIIPVPGMELTTAEDIHIVCLFPTLEAAMEYDEEIDSRRVKIMNRAEIFGEQFILDGNDEIIGSEENLLINATTVFVDEVPTLVGKYGGVCYPAHIDRQANGIVAVLGTFPPTPYFSAAELHDGANEREYREKYELDQKRIIVSSDAHYLTDMRDRSSYIELDDEPYSSALVRQSLIDTLRNGK